jgi:hypothetical protein
MGLGGDSLVGKSKFTNADFVKENQKDYDKWLEKNKEALEKSFKKNKK